VTPDRRPWLAAGTLLGMGLGGFFDGILFHQILQVHSMLSARLPKTTVPNVEINMFWDGLFHAGTWLLTAAGVGLLFRAARRGDAAPSGRAFAGSLALGWGLFNLVEGVIDHHVLALHHVVERLGASAWDWAFLGSGIVLVVVGWIATRTSAAPAGTPPPRARAAPGSRGARCRSTPLPARRPTFPSGSRSRTR
jgi:uncharacterized membrane protein